MLFLFIFLVNLSATSTTKAWNYVDHFEAAYIKSMENFYRPRTSQFINQNGIRVSRVPSQHSILLSSFAFLLNNRLFSNSDRRYFLVFFFFGYRNFYTIGLLWGLWIQLGFWFILSSWLVALGICSINSFVFTSNLFSCLVGVSTGRYPINSEGLEVW